MNSLDRLVVRLVYAQRVPLAGRAVRLLLRWRGTDIDPAAETGTGLRLRHGGTGIVVHPGARLGDGVTLFHNVTIGRARRAASGSGTAPCCARARWCCSATAG